MVQAVGQIDNAETLRALSDPLRLAMIRCLMRDGHAAMTVKELAKQLSQPHRRLYRHIKVLEKAGLIVLAGTRVVSGIIEHRYQLAPPGHETPQDPSGPPAPMVIALEVTLPAGRAMELRSRLAALLDEFKDAGPGGRGVPVELLMMFWSPQDP
ncbi:MAG TPA: helix-turn-helix domain-containing protein [Streptosporangiaceae bacterium]|nr:helix-turn-helix domain-containing protein [Streptosporangiaceae bacterium]